MISAERQAAGEKERVEILRTAYGDEHPEVEAYDSAKPQAAAVEAEPAKSAEAPAKKETKLEDSEKVRPRND